MRMLKVIGALVVSVSLSGCSTLFPSHGYFPDRPISKKSAEVMRNGQRATVAGEARVVGVTREDKQNPALRKRQERADERREASLRLSRTPEVRTPRPEREAGIARPAVARSAGSEPESPAVRQVPPVQTAEVSRKALPIEIRDVILRAWNAMVPSPIESDKLFGIDPDRLVAEAPTFKGDVQPRGGRSDRLERRDPLEQRLAN